jgi:hypothetical protein
MDSQFYTGGLLSSLPNKPSHILYDIPGNQRSYRNTDDNPDDLSGIGSRLMELVVTANDRNYPPTNIIDFKSVEGDYNIGDLFERLPCGGVVCKGRTSDFIKSADGKRIDTKCVSSYIYVALLS